MITIIDYGAGNLRSVVNAFDALKCKTQVTNKASVLKKASAIILPGVGAFGDGMRMLHKLQLVGPLNEQVLVKKKPYLGICLGLQFLGTEGLERGKHKGLGWVKGITRKIQPRSYRFRVPHIGWNSVTLVRESPLFVDVKDLIFYFVHSYHLELAAPDKQYLVGTSWHGEKITAVIQKDNIFGVQFHPEKSQASGLKVLDNFIKLIRS